MPNSILQSQWYNSNSCSGPPSSIYMFKVEDMYNPTETNVTSSFFAFNLESDDMYPGYCGARPGLDINHCCVASLDTERSLNYQSGFTYYLMDESEYMESMLITGTNGYNYCTIIPTNKESTFERMMFLADGKCTDDYYKCLSNGTFTIHQDTMCETPIETINIADIPEEMWSDNFEDVTVIFETVRSGQTKKNWIAYIPPEALVPNTSNTEDIATHICFVVFFICAIQLLWYSIKRYKNQPNRYWFYMILLQIFRIFSKATMMYYYYTVFTDFMFYQWYTVFVFIPATLDSLLTPLLIAHQMFSLNIKFLNPKWKFWIMITLIVFHFAFCFNSYTFFRYLPQVVETGFVFGVELDDLIRRLPPYWITFVMIWDSVPVLLVALVLCATQIQQRLFNWRVMKTVLQVDRVFNIVIATQLLIIILYSVLGYIQLNTDLLGSDRTYFFYGHFRSTIYGIHGLCSGLLIDRLKSFIPKVIETKDSVITSKLTTQ